MATNSSQSILSPSPNDGITNVVWAPGQNMLAASSWDSHVHIYSVNANQTIPSGSLVHSYKAKAPVLDTTFITSQGLSIASVGLDKTVKLIDTSTHQESVLGNHSQAIKCVEYSQEHNALYTGSWDTSVCVWDPRTVKGSPETRISLPERVYTMSLHDTSHTLVVGLAGRHVIVYDTRNMSAPLYEKTSSIKYQTRCIRCFSDGTGYAIASIEGRVGMEYFDSVPGADKKKFAFKCHRTTDSTTGVTRVFPVNALAFHPRYGTFATGGCDGSVITWDGGNKRRVARLGDFGNSIAAMNFNYDGSLLAVASSYTFEEGPRETHQPDQLYIRRIMDEEVKPKQK